MKSTTSRQLYVFMARVTRPCELFRLSKKRYRSCDVKRNGSKSKETIAKLKMKQTILQSGKRISNSENKKQQKL